MRQTNRPCIAEPRLKKLHYNKAHGPSSTRQKVTSLESTKNTKNLYGSSVNWFRSRAGRREQLPLQQLPRFFVDLRNRISSYTISILAAAACLSFNPWRCKDVAKNGNWRSMWRVAPFRRMQTTPKVAPADGKSAKSPVATDRLLGFRFLETRYAGQV